MSDAREELRRPVGPVVEAAAAAHPMMSVPEGVRLPLAPDELKAITEAAMLVVAREVLGELRDVQANRNLAARIAAAEALVAELEPQEKGEQR